MKRSEKNDRRIYSRLHVDTPESFTDKTRERGDTHKIPLVGLVDGSGREALIGSFGDFTTGSRITDVAASFRYFVDPERVTEINTGTGAASINNSRLEIAATGGAGTCEVRSRAPIVYRPGFNPFAYFTAVFSTPAAGTNQECGVLDGTNNGYSLTVNDNNKLVVNYYSQGSLVSSAVQGDSNTPNPTSFSFDQLDGKGASGYTINPQAMNIFRIMYGYLGIAPAIIEVYAGTLLGWVPFHIIEVIGTTPQLIVDNPYMYLTFKVSSDGTNDISMYTGSWLGGSIGPKRERVQNGQFTVDTTKTSLAGGTIPLLSIRVLSTFKGKVNDIPIDIDDLTAGIVTNKPNIVRLIKNPVLTTPVWLPVHADSCVEYDIASLLVTGGKLVRSWPLGSDDHFIKEFELGEIRAIAGDIFTLVLVSTGANIDVTSSIHWDELV